MNNSSIGVVNIKQKLILTILLILGLTLTFNLGGVSAANSSNITSQNTQTIQQTSNTSTFKTTSTVVGATATKNVRVLIYSGNGAITSCVNGIKTALTSANNNNLVPGYYFTYSTSSTISSSILSNYDLLAMPGGTSGKTYINSGYGSVIRSFVSSGHGYLGICAGAYAGSQYVDGLYQAWGVAPHVRSKAVSHEGNLLVTMTSSGSQLLSTSGTVTLAHYNGPAMYASGGSITTFATYADSSTGYLGYSAIVGDTYGNGRTVLSGPHPELSPQNPSLVARMVVWAANVQSSTTTKTFTISQINVAAKTVKAYVATNHKLPSTVTVSTTSVSMAQFLKLLTSDLISVNSGSTSVIALKSVSSPTSATDTVKTGYILKSEYLAIATRVNSFINTYNRAPSYATSTLGIIKFDSLVYMYSRIMTFYATYGRLPANVSMTHWT
jgi:glutamine amidotransferase-like uncharacterized protein